MLFFSDIIGELKTKFKPWFIRRLTMKKSFPMTGLLLGSFVLFISCGSRTGLDLSNFNPHPITISFNMVYVPGGVTFPTSRSASGTATVADAFWITDTEVTYEMWYTVHAWASDAARGADRYYFANPGREGNDGTITDPAGEPPTDAKDEPVTTVSWRDCLVWCNAATEWCNANIGTSYSCVYQAGGVPIRDSRDSNAAHCDAVVPDGTATGFRLLDADEWELAARWRNDATNAAVGYSNPWFTNDDSASGACTYYDDVNDVNPADGIVDGKEANDAVAVYRQYYDSHHHLVDTGVTGTAAVKSKGPNSLGLYDMSGNVWEWCFNSDGGFRMMRGGSWNDYAYDLQTVVVSGASPRAVSHSGGFRVARSAQ
jgi:sulfatase modifying factor 1